MHTLFLQLLEHNFKMQKDTKYPCTPIISVFFLFQKKNLSVFFYGNVRIICSSCPQIKFIYLNLCGLYTWLVNINELLAELYGLLILDMLLGLLLLVLLLNCFRFIYLQNYILEYCMKFYTTFRDDQLSSYRYMWIAYFRKMQTKFE